MKKNIFSVMFLLSLHYASSQVGINTNNPQGIFHIDGNKDNPAVGSPNASQISNDVVVLSNGNVGLGTIVPKQQIHIVESNSSSGIANSFISGIAITGNGSSSGFSGPGFYLENINAPAGNKVLKINYTLNSTESFLNFQNVSDNAGSTSGTIMALTRSGKLGLGTITPLNTISVNGNFAIGSGYLNTTAPANGAIIQGNTGIGTSSPSGILDVASANSAMVIPRNPNPVSNVSVPVAGMILYDSTNKTLRFFNGTQWNTVVSSQALTTANEGVVKLNSGAGVKPFYSFKTSGALPLNVYQNITYQTPINTSTDLSPSPTTSWPENIQNPTSANLYNAGKFLENPIAGQVHTWRVIVKYENKNNGSIGNVTMNLSNPLPASTFSIDQTVITPNGVTTGSLVFYLISIADSLSIGNGYQFKIKSDTPMDITIDSITRISQAKD